ncbi:MAG: 4-(cytidine 5'-diphospho)-2-C-methyl-D-erythritol kinase [Hyphomicrobiales bacterium]|nr:4-(cytidine 5'-diphospho)-2-C-methyl-D-erythritol kinase [Hyphomicrobiales bacterium]
MGKSADDVDEPLTERARAKLNLALHVLARRSDGYHRIDTVVVFAEIADGLAARPAPALMLELDGPFASAAPAGEANLVLRAARMLQAEKRTSGGAHLALTKNLAVEAGIGGGSADAAAALRLLDRMWGCDLGIAGLARIGARLGADVPMCLYSRSLRAGGVGEDIAPLAGLPRFDLVLVNPGGRLSTADIFAALPDREGGGIGEVPRRFKDVADLAAFLGSLRNDLQATACARVPEIAAIVRELAARPGCLMARMSGSGPTVFGIFATAADASRAAGEMKARHSDWWVAATRAA